MLGTDWSPEHGPEDARGITYAQELVRQLFRNYRAAATALSKDAAYAATVSGLQNRLYLPEVSATSGWLEEWMSDDNLGETTHRHLSPLIGLFLGDRIAIEDSPPELVTGATKLLEARGMASFGWASAWRAICWAKLKHADKTYELVLDVLRPSVNFSNGSAINLFDMYSFGSSSVFQIDANYGTPVAMIQMLAQSRPGRVELLPALPRAWAAAGSVTGIGVRGGFTLDMRWKDGQVTDATLRGAAGRSTDVVFGEWSSHGTIPSAGFVTVAPPAQHSVFQLVNRRSGKAVDVPGASTGLGTGLIQNTPSSAANQQFRFVPVGGGQYEIHTTHGSTPLTWAVWGGVTEAGAKITQWTPEHSTSQQWTIADAGDGYITLTCVRSGKYLGMADDSAADGAAVEQQDADGGTGQQWRRIGR